MIPADGDAECRLAVDHTAYDNTAGMAVDAAPTVFRQGEPLPQTWRSGLRMSGIT